MEVGIGQGGTEEPQIGWGTYCLYKCTLVWLLLYKNASEALK